MERDRSQGHRGARAPTEAIRLGEKEPSHEVEAYQGRIEWHRYADGQGRLYRFGLIELTDQAGKHFLYGANKGYRLVVLLDANNIGQAYAFREGDGQDNDFLTWPYVAEKLGRALPLERDAREFTRRLGELLKRPTG